MYEVFIALGSNVGEREAQLANARRWMTEGGWLRLGRCSPLYETEPWGPVAQPWYLDQVCQGWTDLSPRALMRWLLAVERLGGRDRSREERWGPRPLDLDLLAHGEEAYEDHIVQVPHPRLHERRFVLVPLVDIAPEWRHPRLGLTARELLERVEDSGQVRPY